MIAKKLYIYAPKMTPTVAQLMKTFWAERVTQFDGLDFWKKGRRVTFEPGSYLLPWGIGIGDLGEVRVINPFAANVVPTKLGIMQAMKKWGISHPACRMPDGVHRLEEFVAAGLIPVREDMKMLDVFQDVPASADFFTTKMIFTKEFRAHWAENELKALGIRKPQEGFTIARKGADWKPDAKLAHYLVKSTAGGWADDYTFALDPIAESVKKYVQLTMLRLGLSFGEVTVGVTASGVCMVIKVNSSPEFNETTGPIYLRAIASCIV